MYDAIGGIALDPRAPAGRNILVRPRPGGKLTQARAHYDSLYGPIATDWRQDGRNFHLKLSIPANSTATVTLPYPGTATEGGVPIASAAGVRMLGPAAAGGGTTLAVESGTLRVRGGHAVLVTMTQPAPPGSSRVPPAVVAVGGLLLIGAAIFVVVSRARAPEPPAAVGRRSARRRRRRRRWSPRRRPIRPRPRPTEAQPDQQAEAGARRWSRAWPSCSCRAGRWATKSGARSRRSRRRLLALGDAGAAAVIARLDGGKDAPGGRELMFNVLRKMPGEAVERRLVAEARRSQQPAMRTMAIESLAARPTEARARRAGDIARNDPDLPARPLITAPRDPGDTSTELPDETVFSPRMQAMSALAATRDPKAVAVLTDVVTTGPDESLRMEAARNLEPLRADPRAGEVLRAAAAADPSAYVRLAALHALRGANDPSLPAVRSGSPRTIATRASASWRSSFWPTCGEIASAATQRLCSVGGACSGRR